MSISRRNQPSPNPFQGQKGANLFFFLTAAILLPVFSFLSGCASDPSIDLRQNTTIDVLSYPTARNCRISVAPVVDLRPDSEAKDPSHNHFRYWFFPLLWWHSSSAGPIYSDTEEFFPNLTQDLREVMEDTIEKSNLCSKAPESREYVLKPELLHFNGWLFLCLSEVCRFGPQRPGQVALNLRSLSRIVNNVIQSIVW